MSELVGLGDGDANLRWLGIRRHRAILVVGGVVCGGYWLLHPHSSLVELVTAMVLLVGAAPAIDGLTAAEVGLSAIRYALRRRWHTVSAVETGGDVALWASGDVAVRGYELRHRGRLDLAGRDISIAQALASLLDAASAARGSRHFSLHVLNHAGTKRTLLAMPAGVTAPDAFEPCNDLVFYVAGLGGAKGSIRILERLTYLRAPVGLRRTYRVRDFTSSAGSGLLESILRSPALSELSLHIDVVTGARAQRLAARAVHRVGSDDAASRASGFRRSARSSRNYSRMVQRETLVASGRSLVRLAVVVAVRSDSLDELHCQSRALWRDAHDGGLRLERGWGRQAQWHCAQLPGGPGW